MNATSAVATLPERPQPLIDTRIRFWRLAKRSPQTVLGSILVLVFVFVGTFAPLLAPYYYDDQNLGNQLQPPVWAGGTPRHLLGTDEFGRDTLSRLIYGARISLLVGLVSVVLAGALGVTIGVMGGYLGGSIDAFFMRIADVQYSFPYILLAIVITAFWGPGLTNVIVALGLAGWMTFARAARGSTLSVKERDYIMAARALGAGHARIMLCHVLPNIMAPLLVFATYQVPSRILAEATLSFVGLGIQPPMPSWGSMLASNRGYLVTYPWLVVLPGLALSIVALGVNQLGDGLRDLLDPRLRGRT
ncbi:MAG: ABC transporter permease [Chloroflexi bacterium]|nr:ABC transporter permease [Chloroflexota bacterium]